MDRISWTGLVVCIALLFGWSFYAQQRWPIQAQSKTATSSLTATASTTTAPATAPAASDRNGNIPSLNPATSVTKVTEPKIPANAGVEQTAELENDFIIVHFTSFGGSIKNIELKKHLANSDPVMLNRGGSESILNLTGWDGDYTQVPYALQKEDNAIVFTRTLASGAVLKRRYHIAADYQVILDEEVTNSTGKEIVLPNYSLNVGTAGPIYIDDSTLYTVAGYCPKASDSFHKISVGDFSAITIPILGIPYRAARNTITTTDGPVMWASVKNQFFALILSPQGSLMFQSVTAYPVNIPNMGSKSKAVPDGIDAMATMAGFSVAPAQTVTQSFSLYAGPKEFVRLENLGRHEELIMDTWFAWIVRPLLALMRFVHGFIPSWGWTIIVTTILIKGVLWPLQSIANKSMKKMQALQPKLEVLRQKFKDDPQKMNIETMQLYKEYGVNPVGGCLPMLVQMPIFIGFYVMLQSAVEFRGQSFWWIHDLVRPDTIAIIPGLNIPINPLPLIMSATQVLLMRMTPQAGDNQQAKMMQWMPVIMLFILYKFAAALALYWTVSNLISMIQTYINLRKPVPVLKRMPKKKAV